MKRTIISMFVALLAIVTVQAQQIAVVSGDGTTNIYQTLDDAISGATAGSTIYLPGGGFKKSDGIKITKKLTIVGIGHKANSENADGNTVISGNMYFNDGSDDSAVMGCYISGNIFVGDNYATVNNVLIKYCNLNSIQVKSSNCSGTFVCQNYIRGESNFSGSECNFSNNIAHSVNNLDGGIIDHNIFTSHCYLSRGSSSVFLNCDNCTISNNVILDSELVNNGTGCLVSNNLCKVVWGDECNCIGEDWNNVFVNYNAGKITPSSDFHFKEAFLQYSNYGIYGGTGFSDKGMAPLPYIVAKDIPEQTDAEGKLNIKIRVKASE